MNPFGDDKYVIVKPYNDRILRIVLGMIAAHIIVLHYDDDSLFDAILTFTYLRGFLGSFVIALILIEYIHFVTVTLDKKLDWHLDTLPRLIWQTIIGFIAPAILAFLLASLFFYLNGYNIFHTIYLQQDYTLIIFMLLVLNTYYFGLHSFLKLKNTPIISDPTNNQAEPNTHAVILPTAESASEDILENEQNSKEIIVVDTPTKSIPVRAEHISYCYILQGYVFVHTSEMSSLNESYQVSGNLRKMEEKLDKRLFFRINRRMIINFSACKFFKPGKNKTIEVELEPLPYAEGSKIPEEHERLCIVSEDRVTAFKLWMDR